MCACVCWLGPGTVWSRKYGCRLDIYGGLPCRGSHIYTLAPPPKPTPELVLIFFLPPQPRSYHCLIFFLGLKIRVVPIQVLAFWCLTASVDTTSQVISGSPLPAPSRASQQNFASSVCFPSTSPTIYLPVVSDHFQASLVYQSAFTVT